MIKESVDLAFICQLRIRIFQHRWITSKAKNHFEFL